jgi:hypothetical protein
MLETYSNTRTTPLVLSSDTIATTEPSAFIDKRRPLAAFTQGLLIEFPFCCQLSLSES